MKSLNLALSALLTAGVAAALPASALAQYPGQSGPNLQLMEQRKAIQAAEKDAAAVRKDMQKVKTRVQAKYETKEEWEEAQKNLKAAEAANLAARKRAMAKLVNAPEYKAAKEKQAKADQQVQALNAQGDKASTKDLEAAQQARIDAGLVIRKLEADAIDNDAKVAESKDKLADAKKQWESLQDELKQALEQDADYQAAQQAYEAAQANVTQMKQQLQQQQAQEAAARRAAADAERASRSSRSGSGKSGRPY